MKFTLSAATLALVARALALQLTVESDNSEISGKGITAYHEGAAINYYFLGSGSDDFTLTGTTLTKTGDSLPESFSAPSEGIVQLSVTEDASSVSFSDAGVLLVGGSEPDFYACKNTGDSYQRSTGTYQLMVGNSVGTDCIALKLVKSGSSSSASSSAAPSSLAPSSAASSSYVSSASSTSSSTVSSVAFANSTVTNVNTETDTISCSKCTISPYEGAAAQMAKPIGFAAVVGGLVAALI